MENPDISVSALKNRIYTIIQKWNEYSMEVNLFLSSEKRTLAS